MNSIDDVVNMIATEASEANMEYEIEKRKYRNQPAEDERVKRLLAEVRQDIAETSPNSSPMGVFRQHCEDLLQVIDGLSAARPAASTPTECPNCGNSYTDGAICGPTHALIANQRKRRACMRCGHNNVDRHRECRQCIDWQRHKCVFEGAVDTAASTEAQDVTNTGDENAERWRGTMTDRDTTVISTEAQDERKQ